MSRAIPAYPAKGTRWRHRDTGRQTVVRGEVYVVPHRHYGAGDHIAVLCDCPQGSGDFEAWPLWEFNEAHEEIVDG